MRRAITVVFAISVCVAVGTFTIRPTESAATYRQLASRFAFNTIDLNSAPPGAKQQRNVQPSLERIRSWISAVGASVALTDLRGLGHPADACLVDPRDDSVRVL